MGFLLLLSNLVLAGPVSFTGPAGVHREHGWANGDSLVESWMKAANSDGTSVQEVTWNHAV